MFGRLLIAVVLLAGGWEAVLPQIADAAPTSSCPIGSPDGENDAGEEIGLQAPVDLAALIPLQSRLLPDDSLVVPFTLVVRCIPHVPKPALHV